MKKNRPFLNELHDELRAIYYSYPNLITFGLALIILAIGLKIDEWL
jgi:hypothetical protein